MKKKQIFNILKVVISAGLLIYILVYQVDLRQLLSVISSARWSYIVIATLIMISSVFLRAYRWQVLLDALEIKVPIGRLTYLYFVGAFFNIFLPTGLGGDAVKMAELARRTGRGPEAIGTTLVDRATGLWVLFILALVAWPFSYQLLPPGWSTVILAGAIAGVVGGWVVMASPLIPWLGSKVRLPGQASFERLYRSVSQLGYPALGKACLVSLIFNILLIAFNVLIAYGVNVELPIGVFFLFTPVISFSLTIPISVGGLGVREQTYVLLFSAVGVAASAAVAMSLINYVITYIVIGVIGGILYLLEGAKDLKLKGDANPEQNLPS